MIATDREMLSRNSVYLASSIPPGNLKLNSSQLNLEAFSAASWFHRLIVVLLWHPDLLACGKEVKHFMALHCLGSFYNSLDRMIVS